MFVFTTKVTLKKTVVGVLVLCGLLLAIGALAPRAAQSVAVTSGGSISQKLKTPQARTQYIRSFGWDIPDAPMVELEVQIPKEFDAAYTQYNQVQKQQGLDLSNYQGKRAKLYTWQLNQYPTGEEGVTISLLLYRDKVIAADVSAAQADGFVHGITQQPQQPQQ